MCLWHINGLDLYKMILNRCEVNLCSHIVFPDQIQTILLYRSPKCLSNLFCQDLLFLENLIFFKEAITNEDLDYLQHFPNLKFLEINRCKAVTDISSLPQCENLRSLNFLSKPGYLIAGSCRGIKKLTKLQHIHVSWNCIKPWDLLKLVNLEMLELNHIQYYDECAMNEILQASSKLRQVRFRQVNTKFPRKFPAFPHIEFSFGCGYQDKFELPKGDEYFAGNLFGAEDH